ncbi:hypothetical protein [Hungatella hathewayi]|uniref:hypothetical protein n=1 Tax=Hungatella hathewayi TaxID=154046 RepID=UPI003564C6B3
MKQTKHYRIFDLQGICVLIGLCAILLISVAPAVNKILNEREIVVTVMDTGIKNSMKKSRYLVYCKDTENNNETIVLEITDSIFKFRFDSSDMYPNIEPGHTYRFTVCGNRVHILSWYPNIYDYELIE